MTFLKEKPICVSVIMPTLNEGQFIERALRSLQAQQAEGLDLEFVVVDGMSEDGTQQRVAALAGGDPRIKLLVNPARHTPGALNIGLRAAAGEFVCIMGAHAAYDQDYISVCLQELLEQQAVGCSGKVVTAPADYSLQARLVAWAAASRFASSSRSVRTQPEGYADTVPFPVMRKQNLLDLGGYNERLLRNQDNDMNHRLRARGLRLYVTGKTRCRYYARPDVRSFLQYAFRSGQWNAISLRTNAASLGLRHLIPLAFVTVLLALLGTSLASAALGNALAAAVASSALLAMMVCHLLVGAASGFGIALRERTSAPLLIAPVILAFHCFYGLGTLRGILFPQGASAVRAPRMPESSNDAV